MRILPAHFFIMWKNQMECKCSVLGSWLKQKGKGLTKWERPIKGVWALDQRQESASENS